jgi:catechol 2,3-dioxygenase-like lactoylglutathione lyase family enzyme
LSVVHPRHFGIVVSDLDGALAFYRDLLGLKEVRRMEESGTFIETVLALPDARVTTVKLEASPGGVQIELLQFHSHPAAAMAPRPAYELGPTHLALTVDDLDTLHRRMVAAGLPFLSPPQRSVDGRARVAFCRDPEGTLLELVEVVSAQPR